MNNQNHQTNSSVSAEGPPPITVLIVDEERLTRQWFANALQSCQSFAVIGPTGSCDEALNLIQSLNPAVVLTEIIFSERSGIDLLLEIKRRSLDTKAIVLSRSNSAKTAQQALSAGAGSFLSKLDSLEDTISGLRRAVGGEQVISSSIISHPQPSGFNITVETYGADSDPLGPLSPREREIFHHLASGMSNIAIAKKLFISPRTVETHRARLVRKLGLTSNPELIRFAIKNGLATV